MKNLPLISLLIVSFFNFSMDQEFDAEEGGSAVDHRTINVGRVKLPRPRRKRDIFAKRILKVSVAAGVSVALYYGGSYVSSECSNCMDTCGKCVEELGSCATQMAKCAADMSGLREQVSNAVTVALSGVNNITELLRSAQELGIDVKGLLQQAVDNCQPTVPSLPGAGFGSGAGGSDDNHPFPSPPGVPVNPGDLVRP
jgi:hypothetical protein